MNPAASWADSRSPGTRWLQTSGGQGARWALRLRGDSGRQQVPGVAPPRSPASRTPAWDRPPRRKVPRFGHWRGALSHGSGLQRRSTEVQPQQKGDLEGPPPEGLLEAQPRELCTLVWFNPRFLRA